MRPLVTGGSGFIGRHLCRQLVESGLTIVGDFAKCDIVFHLGALTRNDRSIEHPTRTMSSNVLWSTDVFDYARERNIPVVYTSSAVIYSPIRTPYQISKIAADELAQWYNENGGDIRIVRLAEVIGPGMTNGPIAAWREQYRKNGVIDVWEGRQEKDYIYIDDAVDALCRAVDRPKGVNHVGSGIQTDILALAKMLRVPYRIVPAPRPVAECNPVEFLGFRPKVSLIEGMEIIRQKEFV